MTEAFKLRIEIDGWRYWRSPVFGSASGLRQQKASLSLARSFSMNCMNSVAHLLLYGIYECRDLKSKLESAQDLALVNFADGEAAEVREFDDFSVFDELRSLQLGTSRELIEEILTSRFNDEENRTFEGLWLSGGGYHS